MRHRSMLQLLPFLAVAAGLGACDGSMQPMAFCTAPRSLAIAVAVTDSVTGRYLADSASGFVQAGSYAAPLQLSSGIDSLLYGGDRIGTYSVSLTRPGYAPWTRNGVQVAMRGPCGNVLPVHLDALLVATP